MLHDARICPGKPADNDRQEVVRLMNVLQKIRSNRALGACSTFSGDSFLLRSAVKSNDHHMQQKYHYSELYRRQASHDEERPFSRS
jgi:hypothetical protein